jgi:hypothetical protein
MSLGKKLFKTFALPRGDNRWTERWAGSYNEMSSILADQYLGAFAYEPKCGGREEGSCRLTANEYLEKNTVL